ncbi:DUF300-domain-containing protein [Nadsonia fulvescens var. elongata DSM 6958]|uniref:DUF300-domain-containing protein n=1 Tax=Nadsonia fulvescens var. elongata DSM 6958 TaxID=857566 RepID=A0A1E3PJQ6_9ASCO|nr:DUF300-domain-containing protein [Nadsonia fulvescens var. elongata DSM 6958]
MKHHSEPASGDRLPKELVVFASICSFSAIIISCFSIFLHLKNYRKPIDQRLIVRIQLLIPLYALSSWLGLISSVGNLIVEPIREVYEAFVIYTFFTLLTNLLDGERNVILTHIGQPPHKHLFPLKNVLPPLNISDPYHFLMVKRGILQYTWLKPVMSLAIFIMKLTGTYKQGYIGLKSGYMWLGIIYNLSVSMSLYCLALFWVTLAADLAPFRPMPKFLCIKAVIFFSYWQGIILAIMVWLRLIPDRDYFTPDNMARAIQDFLMCTEMLGFALGHWYAFSYKDYVPSVIGFARLPLWYAIRDAFGTVDLYLDFKSTFWGGSYSYRNFDSVESVIDHPESAAKFSKIKQGLRYTDGGRAKYWLPEPSKPSLTDNSPLLFKSSGSLKNPESSPKSYRYGGLDNDEVNVMCNSDSPENENEWSGTQSLNPHPRYNEGYQLIEEIIPEEVAEDEKLYRAAKNLLYGDYNYPVITVRDSMPYRTFVERMSTTSN